MDDANRFWSKVEKTDSCWLWRRTLDNLGYAALSVRGKRWAAHRYAYELVVGPIPEGLELDHLCRVRHCVNPDHLEPVTHRENILRSPTAPMAIQARQTHCKNGHEFTPDNVYRRPSRPNSRFCRICRTEYMRVWRARQHAKP